MRKLNIKTGHKLIVGISLLVLIFYPTFASGQSASTNYRLEEAYFGTGGELDSSSASYRAQQSVGALGVGNMSSANYDAIAGQTTPNAPYLEMGVTGADVNFGTLSPSSTSYGAAQGGTCNCTFYVQTYLSSSYTVVTVSQPPISENGDVLDAKTSQGAPSGSDSVEEFGMNLVANTSPGSFGADLVNVPDNSFADGKIATGYETANEFKYNPGDIIAQSAASAGNQAVGLTYYTISYIAKVSNISEAGTYTMNHVLVAVPIY